MKQKTLGFIPIKTCWQLLCFIGLLSFCSKTHAETIQETTITGIVKDTYGDALPGVNVTIKETSIGVITDLDGKFVIQSPTPRSVLVVSYIGFETFETIIGNKKDFEIVLEESTHLIDEVVIVAYGTQKKQTVTGAISTVKSDELLEVPVANVTNALVGKLPGLITQQPGGRPGEDQTDIYIRGMATFNDASPLIIIDNIEQESFAQLDPNEIESISVLKDASSTAVYGIRGANGVILITTKRGNEGRPKINITANWGVQRPTQIPQYLGSYDHLTLLKKAIENDGKDPITEKGNLLSDESLAGFLAGNDPYRYPDVNWYDEVINKKGSLQQQYNINVSGGTRMVKYFVSLGYLNQGGMFKYQDLQKEYDPSVYFKRYNFRSNIDLTINKYQTLSASISGRSEELNGIAGASGATDGKGGFFQGIIAREPYKTPIYNPDGSLAAIQGLGNPIASLAYGGYENKRVNHFDIIGTLKNDLSFITKGLYFNASIFFKNSYGSTKKYSDGIDTYYYEPVTGRYDQLGEDTPFSYSGETLITPILRRNVQLQLGYGRRFGLHNVNSMLVFNQQRYVTGKEIPTALMGYAARAEYSYADRYLMELSLGYNGSENFAKGYRFGFFPAASLGYVLSEEPFMEALKTYIPYFKIRASLGLVGNDKYAGERFLWQGIYEGVSNGPNGGTPSFQFGTNNPSTSGGIIEKRNENKLLTWETALKQNIGFEGRLFKSGLLAFSVDLFREQRKDILMQGNSSSYITGMEAPYLNIGEVENWGYEFELSHRYRINKFEYYIKGNYTFARNKILNYDDPAGRPDYLKTAGYRIGQYRGYQVLGYFQDEQDILESPDHSTLGGPIIPGDFKYWDRDGDGKITTNDRVAIGYSRIPEIIYSITPGFAWRGFDFSFMLQGAANASVLFIGNAGFEFGGGAGGGQVSEVHKNYWTTENPNPSYPSLHYASTHSNKNINSFHLKSGNYLRLKNIQLGYTFPSSVCRKLGMTGLKIYLSGSNLYTWSKIDNFDPEVVNTSGDAYPQQSVYNVGINVNF